MEDEWAEKSNAYAAKIVEHSQGLQDGQILRAITYALDFFLNDINKRYPQEDARSKFLGMFNKVIALQPTLRREPDA